MQSVWTIIITAIAIIFIITLAFLYYYFIIVVPVSAPPVTIINSPQENGQKQVASETPKTPKTNSFSTEFINFVPPENLPSDIKNGFCSVNSVAQPYRQDAWRCMAGSSVYDPCFSTVLNDVVYCKMNPLEQGSDFLIELTKPLPTPLIPKNINNNWVWFLVLEDGIQLSPYTGTRPIIDGEPAFYGGKILNGGRSVIIGDLIKGQVWTAQKKILVLDGKKWVTKSTEIVRVKTVWQ